VKIASGDEAGRFADIKSTLRARQLHTVCEEASCPNIHECFGKGTASFMILGDVCTRRCPFCDVGHGRPAAPDADEPGALAATVAAMRLTYAVITSVDRDDLRDGGAAHFAACIRAIRAASPATAVEVLVPDFRGREMVALDAFAADLPDVLNHNLETVPRLYPQARPGADYAGSLALLQAFKARYPDVPTKSGLMVGLGETDDEVLATLRDLRSAGAQLVTITQYLRPTALHHPIDRWVTPDQFAAFADAAKELGFAGVMSGPLVRSSYRAGRLYREALAAR